jgi:endonuclease/exonuclease/phosphatase family metal-dependent hydrolase
LRLATFNAASGRSLSDGRVSLEALRESVRRLDADVLALQEVDRLQPRSALADQAAEAAQAMGASSHRYVDLVHGTPGEPGWVTGRAASPDGTEPHDGPSYGVALLSRRPVRAWHVLHLTPPRGRFPLLLPARPPRLIWLPDEPRAVIAAVLEHPAMTVACTHLSFVPGVNVVQLRRVRAWLAVLPGPHLLLGDLNLPGRLPSRITGWTPLVSRRTFPALAPRIQLDHVLVSPGADVSWSRSADLHLPVSDHRALLSEVCLR